MKSKVTLIARVKNLDGGYDLETVETIRRGKPVQPKEPKDVTCYYLRFTENGKRIFAPAGSDFQGAVVLLRNKELQREYTARGVEAPDAIVESSRVTIAAAATQFLANQKTLDKSESTIYGYTRAVEQFQTSCSKVFLDQIDRQDILTFIAWMKENVPTRDRGQQNGTIRTRLSYLSVFLLENKIENPLPKREWPKTDEREVEAFTTEEINQLISKASIDEADLILFLLYTGFRDDEAAHTYYSDVNFAQGTINISNKPELDFTIKNRKQRKTDITLPADFLKRLKERGERNMGNGNLIFPNSKGTPDTSLLTRVRAAAEKSGYTKYFGLHKFRKTFGTIYGENVGIVNAQHALGHADIRTTQKYLAKTKVSAAKVEEMFSGVGD
jgi:integrase/recombinase XerD